MPNHERLFEGFAVPQALDFLRDIRLYNSKAWYEEHRSEFQELLVKPFQALVSDLSGVMLEIDSAFDTRPAIGRTISRIHRDTRFSRDKSLYRDSMWLTFKRLTEDWKLDPCYFFEISPGWYRYGMGYYTATKATMDRMREVIDYQPHKFEQAVAFCQKPGQPYCIEGELYKKPLKKGLPDEVATWYNRKNLYVMSTRKMDGLVTSGELTDRLTEDFALLKPLYKFLLEITLDSRA